MSRRRRVSEFVLLAAALVLALLLLEVALRLFTDYPVTADSNKTEHAQLGYTLSPELDDVDKRGFRNTARTLEESDLAIIGDSHTYGINVSIEQNFPSIVARKTQRSVYNFGVGSYGIYQYKVLIEEAARFSVRDIILAFYPANDLSASCNVTGTDYWKTYAKENELELPDCKDINWDLLSVASIWPRFARVLGKTATIQIIINVFPDGLRRQILSGNSDSNATHFVFEDYQSVKKNFVRLHSKNTSLTSPDIQTNFNNSKTFLLDANKMLADASTGFVVIIIPSKEIVLNEWTARKGGGHSEEFDALLQNELRLTREYRKFFEDNNIAFFDALPHLAEALSRTIENGETFYKPNDGHPLEVGYVAYADAAIKALELLRDTQWVH